MRTDRAAIVERAPAKINLALHVRARRADGYHDIETLFAFLADGDTLTVTPADTDRFTIVGPFADALPIAPDNLVLRARDAFAAAFGPLPTLAIELDKRLPVASGIGGGSADAAAMLRALARLEGVASDDPLLVAAACGLGADVPACLLGRSAIGHGVGELLTPIDGLAATPVLLVNPGVAISTAAVFRGWDRIDRGALPSGDALASAVAGRNDLTAPATALAPVIADVLTSLQGGDAPLLARMSGSGATCFALFADAGARDAVAATCRARGWWCLGSELT